MSSSLSRKDLENDEFAAGIREMHGVSDRAAAIIGGALAENALVEAISSFLKYPEPKGPLFYDQGAPFGTFSNRIVAAGAMGFLSDTETTDLMTIKDIRNQFAHALLPLRFTNPLIVASCEKLWDYKYPDMPHREGMEPSRVKYEMACCGLWLIVSRRATAHLNRIAEGFEKARHELELDRQQQSVLARLKAATPKSGE